KVRRSELFDWMKTLEKIAVRPRAVERRKGTRTKTLVISDRNEMDNFLSLASSQSNREGSSPGVSPGVYEPRIDGKSPCPNPKHNPIYV
ncbi:MAG: hypothetical protein QNJ18_17090, partial [Xenococcaceae cyanobacterium MO_167.B52]|nr:hypothetical protein [Xenococcaceae cyanobacterium MO_167.B52]